MGNGASVRHKREGGRRIPRPDATPAQRQVIQRFGAIFSPKEMAAIERRFMAMADDSWLLPLPAILSMPEFSGSELACALIERFCTLADTLGQPAPEFGFAMPSDVRWELHPGPLPFALQPDPYGFAAVILGFNRGELDAAEALGTGMVLVELDDVSVDRMPHEQLIAVLDKLSDRPRRCVFRSLPDHTARLYGGRTALPVPEPGRLAWHEFLMVVSVFSPKQDAATKREFLYHLFAQARGFTPSSLYELLRTTTGKWMHDAELAALAERVMARADRRKHGMVPLAALSKVLPDAEMMERLTLTY